MYANSKAKGLYSMSSLKMTSSYLERRIIDESLIEDSKERSHQQKSVGLDRFTDENRDPINSHPRANEDEDEYKTTLKNRFGTVQHSSCDGLNSSETTDVVILYEMMAKIRNINITNNLGRTLVCDNSEFNFDRKPPETEVKAKQRNNESTRTLSKQPAFDGKPFDDDDQLKDSSLNACNRSEFCLEETESSDASPKVHAARRQLINNNINDTRRVLIITSSTMDHQFTERNIQILNNFGTILACDNTKILFHLSNNSRKPNDESITTDPKGIIFDEKQLRGGRSNTKDGLATTQNRSEFCRGQAVGLSTAEGEAKLEAFVATCDQPIKIYNNSGIVIIIACSKHHSNASKGSDSKEPVDIENIEITNNFGNTVVCNNSRVNIDLPSNEAIKILDIQERAAVSLDRKLMFDLKQVDDGLSSIRNSSLNRSEFCHS